MRIWRRDIYNRDTGGGTAGGPVGVSGGVGGVGSAGVVSHNIWC